MVILLSSMPTPRYLNSWQAGWNRRNGGPTIGKLNRLSFASAELNMWRGWAGSLAVAH